MKVTVRSIEERTQWSPYEVGHRTVYVATALVEDIEHPRVVQTVLSNECYSDLCKVGVNPFDAVAQFIKQTMGDK